ncbi:MAG TPA: hypothetical protein VNO55_06130 [Polyangia bacterium]|nr:hypothetical protein [Polyangia bacterium]
MKTIPRFARFLFGALVATTLGCSQQPTLVSSHDLDRPTDMVFGCVGLFPGIDPDHAQPSGLPMAACQTTDPASSTHRLFSFVTNSARGELSVVDMDRSKLVDLDPAVAGYNTAPLGQLPETLAISDDGCRVVTANRGSCDLTLVDPGLLMAPTVAALSVDAGVPALEARSPAQTIMVRTGSGKPLAAAPYEVQFLPQDIHTLLPGAGPVQMCLPDRPLVPPAGWSTNDPQTGWKAVVTFPACDLVAVVDLPSGLIVDSVRLRAGGDHVEVVPTGTEPTCPIECGLGVRPVPSAGTDAGDGGAATTEVAGGQETAVADGANTIDDAGDDATDDGAGAEVSSSEAGAPGAIDAAAPPAPLLDTLSRRGVGPLAIHPDGTRLYVGMTNAPLVEALTVAHDTGKLAPTMDVEATIPLASGAVGATRLRLSVDRFAAEFPFLTKEPKQDRKYLYVIARDGTVRVIHVNTQQECDNNVDTTLINAGQRASDCITVAEATVSQIHNPLLTGPGIHLPSNPRDISFAEIGRDSPINTEGRLSGVFGFILTDSGTVYVVNIDATPRVIQGIKDYLPTKQDLVEEVPLANSLRDRNVLTFLPTMDAVTGPPRLDLPPVAPAFGPRIEGIYAFNSADNALADGTQWVKTYAMFPNRTAVNPQTWNVTWEGDLIGLRFSGLRKGPVLSPMTNTALDSFLYDGGGGFCDATVVEGDIVTFFGCSDNAQCGAGQVCVHSTTVAQSAGGLPINGLCLNPDPKTQDTQMNMTCRRLLESVRRYEIVRAYAGELVLWPHMDEVVQVPKELDPNMCRVEGQPCGPPSTVDPSFGKFVYRMVATGQIDEMTKLPKKELRCVNPCGADKVDADGGTRETPIADGDVDCRLGRKCVDFGSNGGGRLCADAPSEEAEGAPGNNCFPQLTPYRVQAGRSFLVQGSVTTYPIATHTEATDLHPPTNDPVPVEANPRGLHCQNATPSSSPLALRIRMDAPACKEDELPVDLQKLEQRLALNTSEAPPLPVVGQPTPDYPPLVLLRRNLPTSANPCLFLAGPNEGDPTSTKAGALITSCADLPGKGGGPDGGAGAATDGGASDGGADASTGAPLERPQVTGVHVRALFRNPEMRFLLSNLEQQYGITPQLRFEVHGGFVAQTVAVPSTIEVGLPSRLLTSPITSVFGGPEIVPPVASPPYLFVVDQRRVGRNRLAGGATRGQILRINLQRYTSSDSLHPLLIYDDFSSTSGLFPIQ